MMMVLWIAAGGAVGAVLRYGLASLVQQTGGPGFPYGTLVVNVSGSLIIGIAYVLLSERIEAQEFLRALLMTGLLGAFTTFSTFSLETLLLLEAGYPVRALTNILLSVLLCLASCWLGILAGRQLSGL